MKKSISLTRSASFITPNVFNSKWSPSLSWQGLMTMVGIANYAQGTDLVNTVASFTGNSGIVPFAVGESPRTGDFLIVDKTGKSLPYRVESVRSRISCGTQIGGALPTNALGYLAYSEAVLPTVNLTERDLPFANAPVVVLETAPDGDPLVVEPFSSASPTDNSNINTNGSVNYVPLIQITKSSGLMSGYIANCNNLFNSASRTIKTIFVFWRLNMIGFTANLFSAMFNFASSMGNVLQPNTMLSNVYTITVDVDPDPNGALPDIYAVTWNSKQVVGANTKYGTFLDSAGINVVEIHIQNNFDQFNKCVFVKLTNENALDVVTSPLGSDSITYEHAADPAVTINMYHQTVLQVANNPANFVSDYAG